LKNLKKIIVIQKLFLSFETLDLSLDSIGIVRETGSFIGSFGLVKTIGKL